MLDIANWVAQDGKHVVGTLIFIIVLSVCLINIIMAIRGSYDGGLG